MWKSLTGALIQYLKCSPFFSQPTVFKDLEGVSDSPEQAKRRPGGWKSIPYIIGNETFERMASYGITANFTVYLLKRFRIEPVAAASMSNIFLGTVNFAPLIGAFIADAYFGRFRTLAYGSISSLLGMVVLTLTAAVPQLRPPNCSHPDQLSGHCSGPSTSQLGVLILSLVLLAVGSGGVRPCSLPFGVDQFDRRTAAGRRGLASFFNWYYCTSTAGVVVGMTVMVYIQDSISWPIGFGVPAICMLCSIIVFFIGTRVYVYVAAEGSFFAGIAQVFVAAYRKRGVELPEPEDASRQEAVLYNPPVVSGGAMRLPLTLQFRFLNKAAIKLAGEVNDGGEPANPWNLCSVQMVEQVKLLIRIIPIWASGIIFFISISQQWTFSVLQSLTMDRHLGSGGFQVPAASVGIISLVALTLFIPVYDRVLVPVLGRITGQETGLSLLQRQGVGLFVSAVSMVVAGVVEGMRRREGAAAVAGMSAVLWLSPQLVLMGVAEAFNAVGQVEFYNQQFPEQMQTVAGSLFYCSLAGAGYLSSVLIAVIQKATGRNGRNSWLAGDINSGHLDYFYYVIAVMGMVNFVYFLVCAHFYRYKGMQKEEKVGSGGGGGGGLQELAEEAFVREKDDNGLKE
ncbi:hypothetical protein M5K25_019702 [Dendrobium thyrsiflorum]|uniref:Uncharacterized protein n=1 Tax=Dendrobium thyrsiflorum TaxID=117978 RepID=A0ABD0UFP2_DENTH